MSEHFEHYLKEFIVACSVPLKDEKWVNYFYGICTGYAVCLKDTGTISPSEYEEIKVNLDNMYRDREVRLTILRKVINKFAKK